MFKSDFATYPQTSQSSQNVSYGENLLKAAAAFIAALFAVKPAVRSVPAVAVDTPKVEKMSAASRVADIRELYRMAAQYDSISPNLAAELRHIAGRS